MESSSRRSGKVMHKDQTPPGPLVYIANHMSLLETLIIFPQATRSLKFIIQNSQSKIPNMTNDSNNIQSSFVPRHPMKARS
jgi:hypothetical protein